MVFDALLKNFRTRNSGLAWKGEVQMNSRVRKFFLGFFVICLLVVWVPAYAHEKDHSHLCRELEAAGYNIVKSGEVYNVPFVEIEIPLGFSITSMCERIPSLSREFNFSRNQIAFFNGLDPNYIKTANEEPNSIEADTLKIPLDLNKVPEIFPAYDKSLADYQQYILVDIGKNYLALYDRGELKQVIPISSGAPGKVTPLIKFKVKGKEKNHFSRDYDDAWMPWALHIKGPYYIHGGVLPGRKDSHGCIRLPIQDAEQLFKSVEVGTPGRIIDSHEVPEVISSNNEMPGTINFFHSMDRQ
jgi:hypothetical protein